MGRAQPQRNGPPLHARRAPRRGRRGPAAPGHRLHVRRGQNSISCTSRLRARTCLPARIRSPDRCFGQTSACGACRSASSPDDPDAVPPRRHRRPGRALPAAGARRAARGWTDCRQASTSSPPRARNSTTTGCRRLAGDAVPAGMLVLPTSRPRRPLEPRGGRWTATGRAGGRPTSRCRLASSRRRSSRSARSGCPRGSRIAVEKPFGEDVESAGALNALLATTGCRRVPRRSRARYGDGAEPGRDAACERRSSSHSGTARASTRSRFFGRRRSRSRVAPATTTAPARSRTCCRATCCSCSPSSRWNRQHARRTWRSGNSHVLRSVHVAGSRRARYTAGTLADGREVPSYGDEEGVEPGPLHRDLRRGRADDRHPTVERHAVRLRAGKALAERRKLVLLRLRGGGRDRVRHRRPRRHRLRLVGAGTIRSSCGRLPPATGCPLTRTSSSTSSATRAPSP